MHMNIHAAVGTIISLLFMNYLTEFQILLIIGVSVLIDFDFIFSKFAENHNHRRLITHTFIPYIILILIGLLFLWLNITEFWIYPFLIGACGCVHVSLDSIDWGILLFYPIRHNLIGGILEVPRNSNNKNGRIPHCYFIMTYYRSKIIKTLEFIFAISAILLIILINIKLIYVFLVYTATLLLHLWQLMKCEKKHPHF
ncbi:MAG: metal-dependent hydrolase [Candidatus Helarchaeota archaeon]